MLIKEPYIDLCHKLTDKKRYPLFHTKPVITEVLHKHNCFSVGVLAHNSPIALMGAGLGSVCIDLNSQHHHEQLNPSFVNLCIYDNKELLLWGLLCRAYNQEKNEVIYILNNFQGSINKRHIDVQQVRGAVKIALKEFIYTNKIDAIFMKDQYFNAINLCDELPVIQTVRNNYFLERTARLDFEVNAQGIVQQEKFYILN